jgi:hypothetical protein
MLNQHLPEIFLLRIQLVFAVPATTVLEVLTLLLKTEPHLDTMFRLLERVDKCNVISASTTHSTLKQLARYVQMAITALLSV